MTGARTGRSEGWAKPIGRCGAMAGLAAFMALPTGVVPAAAVDGPMLCQSFADVYAGEQKSDTALPELFAAPFDFATLDWMDIEVGKAVNVIKRADMTAFPGVSGALFCMADGTIKQVVACIDFASHAADPTLIDRFGHVGERFFTIAGMQATDAPRLAAAVDRLKQQQAAGTTEPIDEYFMLGYARSGFLNAGQKTFCVTITQALSPEMQSLVDGQ
jgi:hypothetical protein